MRVLSNKRWIDWGISLLLGIGCWVFFAVFYRHHLHYQEQLQLFLFTFDYFTELLSRPGGLAIYLGRFVTQFFYDSFPGAFILSLLLVVLQRLVSDAANFISRKPDYRFLTCLPSLGYGILLCNEDVLLSGLVAVVLSMLAIAFVNRIRRQNVRFVIVLMTIVMLYWFAGFASCVFLIYQLLVLWIRKEKTNKMFLILFTFVAVGIWIACPYIAKQIILFYPINRFWFAGDYYRFVISFPVIFLFYFLFVAFLPLTYRFLPEIKTVSKRMVLYVLQGGLLVFITIWGCAKIADWEKEEVMAYGYYARVRKWNSIIAMADKKSPDGPLTVSTLNMALSQKEYLPEYMFTYYQNGTDGLIPGFKKDFNSLLMTGEIYYHLGLINTAQHYAFEAMEAIPDYQKSVRCVKRLAETSLINGQYETAAKYLEILKQTLFYRQWAITASGFLGDEERINNHPEWGALRAVSLKEDFFFSDEEKDMMLGLLYQHNLSNKMAYEYLLAYTLLIKDLGRFTDYFFMNQEQLSKPIPRSYQEAFAMIWSQSGYDPAKRPPFLNEAIVKKLETYRQIYTSNPVAEQALKVQFGDTYWYYFHFRR